MSKLYQNIQVLVLPNNPLYNFTLYKVIFKNMNIEDSFVITIYKRFSELKKLYEQMYTIHVNLCRTNPFPNFVKANFFDRFDDVIIESRRKAAEDLLKFICDNQHLYNNKCFKDFINNGERKSITSDVNVFDKSIENINAEKALPSPILPISLMKNNAKSYDESCEISLENFEINKDINSKSFSYNDNLSDNKDINLENAYDLIKLAEEMELKSNWTLALNNYENAIEILLKFAKLDKNKESKTLIHQKIKIYLDKAEIIKNTHLTNVQITDEDTLFKLLDQCIVLKSSNDNEVI